MSNQINFRCYTTWYDHRGDITSYFTGIGWHSFGLPFWNPAYHGVDPEIFRFKRKRKYGGVQEKNKKGRWHRYLNNWWSRQALRIPICFEYRIYFRKKFQRKNGVINLKAEHCSMNWDYTGLLFFQETWQRWKWCRN